MLDITSDPGVKARLPVRQHPRVRGAGSPGALPAGRRRQHVPDAGREQLPVRLELAHQTVGHPRSRVAGYMSPCCRYGYIDAEYAIFPYTLDYKTKQVRRTLQDNANVTVTTLSAAGLPDRAVPQLLLAGGVGAAHDRPRGRVDRLQPLVPRVRQRLQHAGRLRHVSSGSCRVSVLQLLLCAAWARPRPSTCTGC